MTRGRSVRLAAALTVTVTALAACGSNSAGTSSSSSSSDMASSSSAPALSGTVTFWHAYSADSPEVQTLEQTIIPAFEAANPGVTVKDVAIPYDQLHQKLVTAAAGGELPDVVRSDIIWVPELANLGVLAPLNKEMPNFQQLADSTFPGPLATNMWKGDYYGLPLDTNTRVLMYNADTLAKAGITSPPATFDELVADAAKVKATGSYMFADNGAGGWNMLPWIWSGGGSITDDNVTKATGYLNSPQSVAAVQMLVDMVKNKEIPDIILGGQGGLSTSDGLAKGKYATILDGPWMYPIFAGQYPDFQLQTAPVPAGPGGSVSVVGGEDVVMTEASQNKAAAEAFITYLLSQDAQLAMAKVGQMSVLNSLGDQMTSIQPYYAQFVSQLATARPRPPTPAYPQIDSVLQTEIQNAMSGKKTTQQALDDAATQIDALLAQYSN